MAKYVDTAKQRISDGLKKYTKIIEQAKNRGVNEADTRDIVKAVLGDVLGYDPFFEVTGEYSVKGQYADFGVKLGDEIRFFVEVKSVGTKLEEKQMFQIIGYAANQGHDWGLLTNGDEWQVYRLFTGADRGTERVFSVRLTDAETPLKDKVETLFLVSKEGFRANALQDHWSRAQVLNPLKVAEKLCEEKVLLAIRTELQRGIGFTLSVDAVCAVLLNQVIRGDIADKIKSGANATTKKPPAKQEPVK
ncbi:MAG: type I restriction enzyme HsdR N-terminal domain-containing protein [Armatimonadetes bacterium]|nr:type I restriction enzyme HsdR N-terminal domain-containing protein [Armatimonadota bacterium]